ncbi:MAG: thiamine pyrophosphate-dependent dehydrogenase E1 component subunit alpha, partial [Clostridiales bacterium]|nr:thiamine pyrophosphate-dependent dehydrogenase E1 component subunit alpha [Clostridiales bacterium]
MLNREQKIKMLKDMMVIRRFEDVIKRLYKEGLVEGAIHCYTGEEAVAVGVCTALRKDDYIFSTHRGHGHAIAKGCDLKKVFAELMGRSTGLCKGMGGSMHLFDLENGLMGGNGIVGGGIPLSLGTAYSANYRGTEQVTACFFGEGASNQGTVHEAINMASLWKLPLIFVCENNLFAATTPSYKTLSNPDVAARAAGYSLPGVIADGNDVLDVYEKAQVAVERARKREGPTLLECKTYRVEGHCMVLKDLPQHRPKQEGEGWAEKDPIDVLERNLIKMGEINNKSRIEID